MQTLARQRRTKEVFWRKVLARFTDGGLTQTEFCKREGLNVKNFFWWKKVITTRDTADKNVDRKK